MRFVSLRYGKTSLEIQIPLHAVILTPTIKPPDNDESDIINSALDNPINLPRLESFVNPDDRLLIIVPDKTRKSRISFVLKFVLQRIKTKKIKILFANGTHSKQSEAEKRDILGDEVCKNFETFENDAYLGNFVYYGETKNGTEIFLNKLIHSADKILLIGTITHHYFAGFRGGTKLLIPGVSSYKTAIQNHKLVLTQDGDINPNATNLKLDGNPVYEDIIEAYRLCNLKAFNISIVLDENDRITSVFSGDVIASHKAGAEFVKKFFTIPVKQKFDVVISSAGDFPKDVNFIQSHKAIHHSHYILKNGRN